MEKEKEKLKRLQIYPRVWYGSLRADD